MTTRRYDLNVAVTTSDTPTVSDPSVSTDIMSKGYADTTYAGRAYWGNSVADTTALKAVATTGDDKRVDTQVRVKDDDQSLWKFDASSSATEDGTTVIQPNTGTGRWLAVSGGGGGSSGTASALEALQQKMESEKFGIKTREFDNSVSNSGGDAPLHTYFTGYLIENYTSGGASIKPVWNPIVINDSDKNYDSITDWSVVSAATTLAATAGSTKVGSNHFSFNKDGSAVDAPIRHTLAAQTKSVGANYRVWFWLDLPSVTGLTGVYLRIMGAATTDFSRWNLTTDYAGNAITTGYNLFFVDIKNQAAATTGGTAWTYTQLARYFDVGVYTGSAAQTYTGIKFGGLWFSHGDISDFGTIGQEFTGYNTSTKHDFKLDAANTRHDGVLNLDATVAANYVSGISNADATRFERSTMSWTNNGAIGFDAASTKTSGSISTEQEVRLLKQFRESLSGNVGAFVDMTTPQIYKVTAVGGSTIDVEDPANTSANLLNGNEIHIFETIRNAGEITFALRATRSLTAGSSHSGGTTTLTVSPTSIAVGDYVVKQHLAVAASLVGKTSDESMTAMNYDTTPNGAQLIDQGRAIPNPGNLYASWALGDFNETLALRDRSGNGRNLTKVGSPNLADSFQRGRYAVGSLGDSAYLRTSSSTALQYDSNGELIQISLWVFYNGSTTGADRYLATCIGAGGPNIGGWILYVPTSSAALTCLMYNGSGTTNSSVTTSANLTSGWNHVVLQIQSSTYQKIYLNGVLTEQTSVQSIGTADTAPQAFYIGVRSTGATVDSGMNGGLLLMKSSDAHVWRDGSLLTTAQIQSLYNAGAPVPTGFFPVVRNEYSLTGQSGQKLSMRARMSRSTTAVNPQILDLGALKTS